MKRVLNFEKGKRILAELKVGAPARKDGQVRMRLRFTATIEDGALDTTVLTPTLAGETDRLALVRKDEQNSVGNWRCTAKMRARHLRRLSVWSVVDGKPGELVLDRAEAVLDSLSAEAGSRHTKQVHVVDVYGSGSVLGRLLDVSESEVLVRLAESQGDLFVGDDEDELPEEPEGEQTELPARTRTTGDDEV